MRPEREFGPQPTAAWLLKKSPNLFRPFGWDVRFVLLIRGCLYWARTELPIRDGSPVGKLSGHLDLSKNPGCRLEPDGSSTRFTLSPADGGCWVSGSGDFSGGQRDRAFRFDAVGSKDANGNLRSRADWMEAFQAHMAFAASARTPFNALPDPAAQERAAHASPGQTQAAKAAFRQQREEQRRAQARAPRPAPVIRDATEEEIAAARLGPSASFLERQHRHEEEIQCDKPV